MPENIDLGTAVGRIEIDASGAASGAGQATKALSSLDDVVRNNWWGLRNLGLAFAGFSTAVVGAFTTAAVAAVRWEDAMAGVERTTWDAAQSAAQNRAEIEQLGEALRDMSTIKPIAAENLAAIAEEAGALGLRREDIAAFTSVVADLAATTDLTEETATTNLARIAGLLGVPAQQFQNLGSAILETGRSTAATETDIVNLSNRLAGIGAQVGLSADQVVALAAAVRSAGIQVESGGTAIQRTFIDMQKAIAQGGDKLDIFARVAGMTAAEFATLFQQDAAQALTRFVQGLSQMEKQGVNTVGVLANLDIVEQRQLRTLLSLAAAEGQTVNSNLRLSTILGISSKAFAENTALAEIAARRYQTVSAQLQILRNQANEAARAFGVAFLPYIKLAVTLLTSFVQGMQAMPGPLRVAIATIFALVAGIGGLAAALLLIGPRVILVRQALAQLAEGAAGSATAVAAATAAEQKALANLQKAELAAQTAKQRSVTAAIASEKARSAAAAKRAQADQLAATATQRSAQQIQAADNQVIAATLALEAATVKAAAARQAAEAKTALVAAASAETQAAARAAAAAATLAASRAEAAQAIAADRLAAAEGRASVAREAAAAAGAKVAAASEAAAIADTQATLARQRYNIALANSRSAAANVTGATAAAATATAELGATSAATGGMVARLAGFASKFTRVLGWLGIALTVAGVATTIFGSTQKKAVDPAKELADVNMELVEAIKASAAGNDAAVRSWIANQLAMAQVIPVAQSLGFTIQQLTDIIRGLASAQLVQQFVEAIVQAEKRGVEGAARLGDAIQAFFTDFKNANEVARQLTSAQSALGVETEELALDQEELAKQARKAAEELDKQNQAILDLTDAYFSQRQAGLQLIEATDRLAEAQANAVDPARALAAAERDVNDANRAVAKSARDVAKAQKAVDTARADALDDLAEAEDDAAEAHDNYYDALDRVADAEEKLEKLRQGPTLKEITDATNKLRNAQLRLRDAQQGVADSQWYLNYLREEGASDRDLLEAQNMVDDANQEVADSTADVSDAQEELNDLRDGADPRELAAAERDLRDAQREVRDSLREIAEREEAVQILRDEVANDTAYKDAVDTLAQAQDDYADAVDRAKQAELDLAEVRRTGGDNASELAEAQLGVEQALYNVARANADARVAEMKARGEYVDAGREAHILADELQKLVDSAPNAQARQRLLDFIGILRRARPGAPPTEDEAAGPKPITIPPPVMPDISKVQELDALLKGMDEDAEKRPGIWQTLKEKLSTILGGIGTAVGGWAGAKVGGSIGASIGTGIAPGVGTVIGGVVGAIIGLLAGQLLGKLINWVIEKGPGFINAVVSWFTGIPGGIKGALDAIWDGITGFFYDLWWELVGGSIIPDMITDIVEWFGRLPGMILSKFVGALGWLFEKGRDILRGLWNGIWDFWVGVFNGALDVGRWIKERVGDTIGWLFEKGKDILRGLYNGILDFWHGVFGHMFNLGKWITDHVGSGLNWLKNTGRDIIQGLINGMLEMGPALLKIPGTLIGKAIKGGGGLLGGIADAIIPGSPSKVTTKLGEAVALGLVKGMEDNKNAIVDSLDGLFSTFDEFDPRMLGQQFVPDVSAVVDTRMLPPVTPSGASAAANGEGGDTINISTVVQDAQEIANEIAWRKLVRTRR